MGHPASIRVDTELLTTSHVARMLACSEGTVRDMANRGALPCRRLASGLRVFVSSDVDRVRTALAAADGSRALEAALATPRAT